MLLLINTFIVHLLACDPSENDPVTDLNPGCNYAGRCFEVRNNNRCVCCIPDTQSDKKLCGEHWNCDPENPSETCVKYEGSQCTEVVEYNFVAFGFRAGDVDSGAPSDVECHTVPKERALYRIFRNATLDFGPQVAYVAKKFGWNGTIKSAYCDTCSPVYPCTLGISDELNVTSGTTYGFQIDFQEYYNISCGSSGILYSLAEVPDCEANYDYGQQAHMHWAGVRGDIDHGDTTFLEAVNDILWGQPDASNDGLGLNWTNTRMLAMGEQITKRTLENKYITDMPTTAPTENPTVSPTEAPSTSPTDYPTVSPTEVPSTPPTDYPTVSPSEVPTTPPTENPTENPTESPTEVPTTPPTEVPSTPPTENPTESPTEVPTILPTPNPTSSPTVNLCGPYTNQVEDLVFQGVGSNCRAGLNATWPGGLSCDSPYVVCLPMENTPGAFGGEPYKSKTHRYSVDECLQECANDQRCLGVEFVADSSSSLGDCSLIDDIPLQIEFAVSGFNYSSEVSYLNLDSTVTNGNALCFAKQNACNPYFEAGALNDAMLNCYCPNNRKGYYTKKVKRTINNTRFCGDDPAVDMRIQKAQANRMFHLCENWCLFLTDDPEAESWYWDPWKTCFREQYAGVGEHMSYCTRVIRNPDTIEMQFLIHRSTVCQNEKPTEAPSVLASSWYIAIEEASCDDVCHSNGLVCDENLVASVVDPTFQSEMYFKEAGVTCESISRGEEGWALPGFHTSSGTCLVRNNVTKSTPCNWAIGVGYRRLCACV